MSRLKVLLTGPGGRIGPHILPAFMDRYNLVVADRRPVPGMERATIIMDLQDQSVLRDAMAGVDVVVHLAATSDEAPFLDNLMPNNVAGVYNVMQAAVDTGVRRVVFASTGQTVSWRQMDRPVRTADPPQPLTIYGVTKVFGEVLGRFFHDKFGIEFIAIRIGAFETCDSKKLREHVGLQNSWLSPCDAVTLLQLAVEKPGVGYAVIFGTSKTREVVLSLDEAREVLGYEPQDDIRDILPDLRLEQ
ncbi:MAG: NAD-dependent epimerase/dehydratase family protein [Capsulimonadaceae bacterium]